LYGKTGIAANVAQMMSPTRILKARKVNNIVKKSNNSSNSFIEQAFEQKTASMSKNDSSFAHLTICFSLFEYLAQGFDYACKIYENAAEVSFEQLSAMLSSALSYTTKQITSDNPRICEQILTEYVKLLIIHSRRQPTPPRILRETLLFSLKKFPRNTVFLMLFVESEIKVPTLFDLDHLLISITYRVTLRIGFEEH